MVQQLVLFQSLAIEKLIALFICPSLIYILIPNTCWFPTREHKCYRVRRKDKKERGTKSISQEETVSIFMKLQGIFSQDLLIQLRK